MNMFSERYIEKNANEAKRDKFVARYSAYFGVDLPKTAGWSEWINFIEATDEEILLDVLERISYEWTCHGRKGLPGLKYFQIESKKHIKSRRLEQNQTNLFKCSMCRNSGWVKVVVDKNGRPLDVKSGSYPRGNCFYVYIAPCICEFGEKQNAEFEVPYTRSELEYFQRIGFPFSVSDREIQSSVKRKLWR